MARILIAASPHPRSIVQRILVGHETVATGTISQATRCLRSERFDLIVCTVLFDECRMFDFLRVAKSKPGWAETPFVCARVKAVVNEPVAWEAINLASRELGAAAFLNVADYPADPDRQMRRAIDRLLQK